ncbi:MAG: ATP-binding protein [Victivallales bacterium]|nr:ATP-binding protein [Victivallales bacterium]
MKDLTSSVYTFEDLIEGNFLYIDKTEYLWRLIQPAKGIYFLARPRRFGKSLALSTLKAVFQGKKALFKGLVLESKPYDWKVYPVIHLDFGNCDAFDADSLRQYLIETIDAIAKTHNISLTRSGVSGHFTELVEAMTIESKIVILIDEYDKPILDNITNPRSEDIRQVMEDFYSVVKGTEPYQRFVMLTGVSKFSKVSVFSKLNNLTDISMNANYATMFGYTQQELESNFADYINSAAKRLEMDRDELLRQLKEWYNGYRFEEDAATVYNPVSIAKFFESGGKFKNFWFETGTPRFLIDLLKQNNYDLPSLENLELDEVGFSAYEITNLAVEPLLFQTGYITIHSYDPETMLYTLGYPNMEVKNAFIRHLMDVFTPVRKEIAASHIVKIFQAARSGAIDALMAQMRIFFSNIPNNITLQNEKYYQTVFYLVLKLVGIYIDVEVNTESGRINAVLQSGDRIIIAEFKLHDSAESALQQIKDKKYYEKYLSSGKEIIILGAAFDAETRNIEHWTSEIIENTPSLPL